MTIIPALVLPARHTAMNSPAPSVALSADGTAYYGVQTKVSGVSYAYRVYVQQPAPTPATVLETGIGGQGRLQETCGLLVASGCQGAGDGKPVLTFVVPGFVGEGRMPIVITPDSPIGRLWLLPYSPADLDTPEELAARFNKLKAAFIELVSRMEAAGDVRRV